MDDTLAPKPLTPPKKTPPKLAVALVICCISLFFASLVFGLLNRQRSRQPEINVAAPINAFPYNLQVSNLTSGQFTLSFITDTPADSAIFYSDDPDGQTLIARNYSPEASTTHSITVSGLVTDKTYYFKVCSQDHGCSDQPTNLFGAIGKQIQVTSDNCTQNGSAFIVQTLPPSVQPTEPVLIYGEVVSPQTASGILTFAFTNEVQRSRTLSTPITNNRFALDLSNLIDHTTNEYITDITQGQLTLSLVSSSDLPLSQNLTADTYLLPPLTLNFSPETSPIPTIIPPSPTGSAGLTPTYTPIMLPVTPTSSPLPTAITNPTITPKPTKANRQSN